MLRPLAQWIQQFCHLLYMPRVLDNTRPPRPDRRRVFVPGPDRGQDSSHIPSHGHHGILCHQGTPVPNPSPIQKGKHNRNSGRQPSPHMVMWHLRHEYYPSPSPREQTPARSAVRLHIPRAHARPPQIPSHLAPHRKPPVPMGRRMPEARHQRATQRKSRNPPTLKHCGSRRPTAWPNLT